MTEEKTYTPEQEARLQQEADAYFARIEADAKRAILAVKTIHPEVLLTVVARHPGGHAIVITDDDPGEVVAAVYKTYAQSKN